MKKKSLSWISVLLLMLAGCSSSDDNDTNNESTLYKKTWKLVSYGNESNAVLKEAKGFEYIIILKGILSDSCDSRSLDTMNR